MSLHYCAQAGVEDKAQLNPVAQTSYLAANRENGILLSVAELYGICSIDVRFDPILIVQIQ